MTLTHHTNGGHVIGTKNRRRPDRSSEQLGERLHAAFHGMVALNDQRRIQLQADLLHGSQERLLPRHRGFQPQRAGNERDLLVTKCGQMLYRLTDPVQIVDLDVADLRARRSNIDKDQRYLP